jgi:hypothetical protein
MDPIPEAVNSIVMDASERLNSWWLITTELVLVTLALLGASSLRWTLDRFNLMRIDCFLFEFTEIFVVVLLTIRRFDWLFHVSIFGYIL